jgi:integrase
MISLTDSALSSTAPTEILRTVAPTRHPNVELRAREHLTPGEVDALIEAAKANRYGHRDATMILIAFRHGLRAAEVCDLRWDQVDLAVQCFTGGGSRTGHRARTRSRRRAASTAPAAAREPSVAHRFRQRAGHAIHDRRLCQDDRAGCSARPRS